MHAPHPYIQMWTFLYLNIKIKYFVPSNFVVVIRKYPISSLGYFLDLVWFIELFYDWNCVIRLGYSVEKTLQNLLKNVSSYTIVQFLKIPIEYISSDSNQSQKLKLKLFFLIKSTVKMFKNQNWVYLIRLGCFSFRIYRLKMAY